MIPRVTYAVERADDCDRCHKWRLVRVTHSGTFTPGGPLNLNEERIPVATCRTKLGIRLWLWWHLPRRTRVVGL